jgi:hypothetical protein
MLKLQNKLVRSTILFHRCLVMTPNQQGMQRFHPGFHGKDTGPSHVPQYIGMRRIHRKLTRLQSRWIPANFSKQYRSQHFTGITSTRTRMWYFNAQKTFRSAECFVWKTATNLFKPISHLSRLSKKSLSLTLGHAQLRTSTFNASISVQHDIQTSNYHV